MMLKQTILLALLILVTILIATVLIYTVIGNISGEDAICISGLTFGFLISFAMAKHGSLSNPKAPLGASLIVCVPLLLLSNWASNIFEGIIHMVWPLSIGFSIFLGFTLGGSNENT